MAPTATIQEEPPTKRQATLSNPTITLTAGSGGVGGGDSGSSSGEGGLTKDQKIAIGVGVPSAIGTLIAGIVAWRKCCLGR
jgi:hypothetical protein